MSALEKFKRRLVRDIARRQYVESQPENEMWDQLKTEYGCDCFLLWQHMKVLTSKKLKRLLAADDRVERITQVARMTSTDWLTFDLVLVHQDVDVIGEGLIQSGKPESQVLQLLFDLVIMYCIEDCSGDRLIGKWAALTRAYNSGGRECSAMLLQRRWHQLKDYSRRRVYEFWKQYRGNPRNLPKAVRPTNLQIRISEALPYLITERFLQWKDLLESGKIIMAVQFENRRRQMEPNVSNDDPDLVVIEPHVETIELGADSEDDEVEPINENVIDNTEESITAVDNDDNQFERNTLKYAENSLEIIDSDVSDNINKDNDVKVPVKTESTEVLQLNELSDDEAVETDNFENTEEKFEPEHVENDCKYPENDLVLPKITNVMGNVDIDEKCNSISHITNDQVISYENAPKDSDTASCINLGDSNETFEENVKENLPFNADDVMDISELPSTLEFVDDGIEFVDDDADSLEGKGDTEDGNKIVNLDDVDPSYAIDRKLVMIPITYTKKLENMNVLRNFNYTTVKGNQLIELIESESKIITLSEEIKTEVKTDYEHTEETTIEGNSRMTGVNGGIKKLRSEDNCQMNNVTNIETGLSKYAIKVKAEKEEITKNEDDSEKCKFPRVKYTSWLLQKPKHRNYNPILLCKNPDFNTRLKRLGVGFFLSERNRKLFNACKPLTVDMHKAFETKLVNNVLYLEKPTTPYIKEEKVAEVCENTASVIPSAVPVQSLLDMTRVEQKDLLPQETQMDESKSSPDHTYEDDNVIERGHVINEPLMTTMDLAKEGLIKKENTTIAPTSVSNTRRPAEIIGAALNTLPPPTNNKKNKTKPKPPAPAPSWTNYGTVIEYEESLITKDTLNKVLCFLDTGVFQTPRKGGAAPAEATKKSTTKGPIALSPSTYETSVQDKRLKSTSDSDELNWNNMVSQNTKRRRNNPHSITPQSGYCCWARNKIDFLRTENKNINSIKTKQYRHLCPMGESGCICCCRQDLLETMVSNKLKLDHTYSRESDLTPPKGTIETRDLAIQATLIRNESGQMEIKSTIELYHPQIQNLSKNPQGKIVLDEETKNSNDSTTIPLAAFTAIPSSGSKQSVNNEDSKIFAHASSNTSDFLFTDDETAHVQTPPKLKTKVIPALRNRGNRAELFSVTAEAGREPKQRGIAVNKNIDQKAEDEVISLIDEEESVTPNQTSSPAPKQLLPKGVNILLLPDKTLSVSIEPGVQIDPVSLSKLPEILSAVQSKLLQPGVLNKSRKLPISRWKCPSGNLTSSRNTVDNVPTIVNGDPQNKIVNENPKVNAVNPGLNDIHETAALNTLNTDVSVTEDNVELVVMDPEVQDSTKSDELNTMNSEVNFSIENAEVAIPQQNAELIAIDPISAVEKGQTEHNMNPELHISEENAELIAIDPKVPVTEKNNDLVVNSENDIVDKNAELTIINVNSTNCEVNVINNELFTTENTVNDMNSVVLAPQASINVVNGQLNASEENTYLSNSNTDTNITIAETTPMLYVDSLQPTVGTPAENVTKDDEDKLIYTDYIVKVKPPDTSRKTILSDLMTMSGISTEDATMLTEPPASNVINYNLQDDPYYLTNTYNVGGNIQIAPPPKKVKKVMVFIKKRSKAKSILNEPVIDLTEENYNSAETSKQNDPQTDDSPKKESDGNKILNLKRAKLVRVPAAAVPHKIYQAAQSLLRKDNTLPVQDDTTVSSREIETQMKIHLARHYRKLNKKPTILDILKNIKNSKEIQATRQSRNQSESSDDEPLAKKSRRMRTENTDDHVSLNVVPVGQYNVPVEYNLNEPVMFVPAASDIQDADNQIANTEDVDSQNADTEDVDTENVDTQHADDQDADFLDADTQNIDDQEADILDTDNRETDTNTDADEDAILGI